MISLDRYIIRAMKRGFSYGENDCVLFTGIYFQKLGAPVFEVIEENIKINRKNWPSSFKKLEQVATIFKFKNVSEMHESLILKIGFTKAEIPQDGDLVLDFDKHTLGLGWKGGSAFLSDESGITVCNPLHATRWRFKCPN